MKSGDKQLFTTTPSQLQQLLSRIPLIAASKLSHRESWNLEELPCPLYGALSLSAGSGLAQKWPCSKSTSFHLSHFRSRDHNTDVVKIILIKK